MKTLIVITFFILVGCATQGKNTIPEFSVSESKVAEYLEEFRTSNSNVLFLFMVDRDGNIVRHKILASKTEAIDSGRLRSFGNNLSKHVKFPPAANSDPVLRQTIYSSYFNKKVVTY